MIKLFVFDLDGTLLDDDKDYNHARFARMIPELEKRGIVFAPASGRSYPTLRSTFEQFADRMAFICENGNVLAYRGEILSYFQISDEDALMLLEESRKVGNMYPLFCGLKNCYYEDNDEHFVYMIKRYFNNMKHIDHVEDCLKMDVIIKLSFQDKIDVFTNSLPGMQHLSDRFTLAPSGENWLDFYYREAGKGTMIKRLQEHLGISPDETMCFGDYLNDLTLVTAGTESYAMKNAHPDIKKLCKYETKWTNNEDGVINTIAEVFGIQGI